MQSKINTLASLLRHSLLMILNFDPTKYILWGFLILTSIYYLHIILRSWLVVPYSFTKRFHKSQEEEDTILIRHLNKLSSPETETHVSCLQRSPLMVILMIFAKQTWNWLWSKMPAKVCVFKQEKGLNSKLMSKLRTSNILILWRLSPGTACPCLLESTIHQPRRKTKLRKKALMRNHFPAVFSAHVFSVFSFSDDVMHQELLSWVKYLNMKCIPASSKWKQKLKIPPPTRPLCCDTDIEIVLTFLTGFRVPQFWHQYCEEYTLIDPSLILLHRPLRMIIGEQVFRQVVSTLKLRHLSQIKDH